MTVPYLSLFIDVELYPIASDSAEFRELNRFITDAVCKFKVKQEASKNNREFTKQHFEITLSQ